MVFLAGRLYTRIHVHQRLYFDDALVIFAWMLLLISTVIWQHVAKDFYELMNLQIGPSFADHVHTYLVNSIPITIFFYTGLWTVKLSFLIFFRRLGSMVRNQKSHWWVVSTFTVVTWITTFGLIPYHCMTDSLESLRGQTRPTLHACTRLMRSRGLCI